MISINSKNSFFRLTICFFLMLSMVPEVFAQIPRGIARTKRVRVQAPPKLEFIDKKGKRAIPYKFHAARPFAEGLAPVLLGEEWGYIDTKGVLNIGANYSRARDFSEGLAAVRMKKSWGYADRTGKIVIPTKFAACGDFKNGIAVVYVRKGSEDFPKLPKTDTTEIINDKTLSSTRKAILAIVNSRRAGYIDRKGNYLIKPKYLAASPFSGDYALVKDGKTYYFIDKKGETKIKPDCTRAKSFSEGFAAIKTDGKWGFIDELGKIAIKPNFDSVQSFAGGLAAAKQGKLWGFIDKRGKWKIEPQFSSVWNGFDSGVAVCAKDVSPIKDSFGTVTKFNSGYIISRTTGAKRKFDESTTPLEPGYFSYPDYMFGLIDKEGKEVAPFKFGEIGELADGLRPCEVDGRYGFIDNIGNIAIKPVYRTATKFSDGLAMVKTGPTSSRKMRRAFNLLKHSVPSLVNDPELIKKDIAVADQVIKLDPENAQAYRDKGYFLCCLQEFEKSIPEFSKVIELCPISTEGYYWRGHSYLQLKEYEKAAKDFTKAISYKRSSDRLYSGRAQAYLGLKKNKLAFVDITRAIKNHNRPFYHGLLARVFKRLGQEKRWYYESWLSRRSTNLNPWPAWARTQRQIEAKIKKQEEILSSVDTSTRFGKKKRVLALTQLADTIDSLRRLKYREEKMLELEALFKRAYAVRKEALETAKAVSVRRMIQKMLTNDYANSIAQMASWYTKKEQYEKASELNNTAFKLARLTGSMIKQSDYLNDLAKIQIKQKKYPEAEESLKKSLALTKGKKRTLMKIIRGQSLSTYAILLLQTKRENEAEKMLQEANEHLMIGIKYALLPSPPQAPQDSDFSQYYELGVQCKSMGLIEMARTYMQKAMDSASDDVSKRKAERFIDIYLPSKNVDLAASKVYLTGRTAEVAGDFITAEKYYTDLIKSSDKFSWPYIALARIYRENGQLAKAEKNVKKALSINKQSVEALIELSKINQARGRVSKGISYINKALKIDPDNQLARFVSDRLNSSKTKVE